MIIEIIVGVCWFSWLPMKFTIPKFNQLWASPSSIRIQLFIKSQVPKNRVNHPCQYKKQTPATCQHRFPGLFLWSWVSQIYNSLRRWLDRGLEHQRWIDGMFSNEMDFFCVWPAFDGVGEVYKGNFFEVLDRWSWNSYIPIGKQRVNNFGVEMAGNFYPCNQKSVHVGVYFYQRRFYFGNLQTESMDWTFTLAVYDICMVYLLYVYLIFAYTWYIYHTILHKSRDVFYTLDPLA